MNIGYLREALAFLLMSGAGVASVIAIVELLTGTGALFYSGIALVLGATGWAVGQSRTDRETSGRSPRKGRL